MERALPCLPRWEFGDNSCVQPAPRCHARKRVHFIQSPCFCSFVSSQDGVKGTAQKRQSPGEPAWPRGRGWPLRYPRRLWPQRSPEWAQVAAGWGSFSQKAGLGLSSPTSLNAHAAPGGRQLRVCRAGCGFTSEAAERPRATGERGAAGGEEGAWPHGPGRPQQGRCSRTHTATHSVPASPVGVPAFRMAQAAPGGPAFPVDSRWPSVNEPPVPGAVTKAEGDGVCWWAGPLPTSEGRGHHSTWGVSGTTNRRGAPQRKSQHCPPSLGRKVSGHLPGERGTCSGCWWGLNLSPSQLGGTSNVAAFQEDVVVSHGRVSLSGNLGTWRSQASPPPKTRSRRCE